MSVDRHLWSSSCKLQLANSSYSTSRALDWALGQHCGVWTVANKSFGVGTGAALCSVDSGKQVSITNLILQSTITWFLLFYVLQT